MSQVLRFNRLTQVVLHLKSIENIAVRNFAGVKQEFSAPNNSVNKCYSYSSKRWSSQYVIKSSYSDIQEATESLPEVVWKNLDKWSSKIATVCAITGKSYTYEETRSSAYQFAKALLGLGLKPGDVVALLLPNMAEYPIAFYGALEAGLVVTTLNPIYTPAEVARQLKDSGSVAAVTVPHLLPSLSESSLASIILIDEDNTEKRSSGNMHSFRKLIKDGDRLGPSSLPKIDVNDTAALLYSSGTTGISKGVELTHRNIATNIDQHDNPELSLCKLTTDSYQDKVMVILPMYHVYAIVCLMVTRMTKGVQLVTLPKFDPKTYISALEKHKFTMLYLVPPLINFMANSPEMKPHHLESVNVVLCGAAPLSLSSQQKLFERTKCPAVFQEGYGMTESSPIITLSPKDPTKTKFGSCGNAVANTELKIADIQSGEALAPNTTGEVCIRGPQVMKGYLNNPKATAETIDKDGWLHTGDLGYVDDDKFLYVVDRLKELIKVKGFQVAPAELEEILLDSPDVEDAAVVGIPDERSGEVPRAFVVSSKTSQDSAKNIAKYVEEKVAPFKKIAGGIVFVESIPKSAAGKILRKQLRGTIKGKS